MLLISKSEQKIVLKTILTNTTLNMIPSPYWRYGHFSPFFVLFGSYVFRINTFEVLKVIMIVINNLLCRWETILCEIKYFVHPQGACETNIKSNILFLDVTHVRFCFWLFICQKCCTCFLKNASLAILEPYVFDIAYLTFLKSSFFYLITAGMQHLSNLSFF